MSNQRAYRRVKYAFGNQLLQLRTRVALTQIALAVQVGVHRRSVQNWETGVSYPKPETLQRLIAVFLQHQAFTPGNERVEAQTLWEQAAHDGPHTPVDFDAVWFARLPAANLPPAARPEPAGDTERRATVARGDVVTGRAGGTHRRSLPVPLTPLIGRSADVAELALRCRDPACRLVTLLGPGGIGKTRLAIEVAATQTEVFADGVVFVALASVRSPDQIASAITDALQLTVGGQSDPTEQVISALHDRALLLVLDTFEHVLEAVELVGTILTHAPHVMILTTTRERLNLQAEWLFDVEGLAYPAPNDERSTSPDSHEQLVAYSAVQLFLERMRQVRPGLRVTASMLTMIARICRHVDGMPLAIELAAGSTRTRSVGEIERLIRTNVDALTTTLRDVPPRHRSMRAVFDHSWALLNAAERELMGRFAVFRGGCTAQAAEHVAAAAPAVLAALVEKSLLSHGRDAGWSPRTVGSGEPRFVMLEPLRQYSEEFVAARGEAETLHRAHAAYYMGVAESVIANWGSPTAEHAIECLDDERDNMRAALGWARDGGDRHLGLRLGAALSKFWQRRGASSEGRWWLEQLLQANDDTADVATTTARLHALEGAARLAAHQYDYARALQLFEQSMAVRRTLGAEGTGDMGRRVTAALAARAMGDYDQATALLEDAVAHHRATDDRKSLGNAGLGLSLFLLGMVYREQGYFVRATALFEECIDLHRAIGDREGTGIGLLGLADIARDQGNIAQMRTYGEESLAIVKDLEVHWAIGVVLNILAFAAYLDGDLSGAAALSTESVTLLRAQQADGMVAEALMTLGLVTRARGDVIAANTALTETFQLATSVGPRIMLPVVLEGLADVMVSHGHIEPSVRLLAAAAAARVGMGTPVRPVDQASVAQVQTTARSILGDDTFSGVWAEATELPLDHILRTVSGAATLEMLPGKVSP